MKKTAIGINIYLFTGNTFNDYITFNSYIIQQLLLLYFKANKVAITFKSVITLYHDIYGPVLK